MNWRRTKPSHWENEHGDSVQALSFRNHVEPWEVADWGVVVDGKLRRNPETRSGAWHTLESAQAFVAAIRGASWYDDGDASCICCRTTLARAAWAR